MRIEGIEDSGTWFGLSGQGNHSIEELVVKEFHPCDSRHQKISLSKLVKAIFSLQE